MTEFSYSTAGFIDRSLEPALTAIAEAGFIRVEISSQEALRRFVLAGGGLMIDHDTGWFMASPFPEIAVRDVPTQRVESVRHVVETDLQVVLAHPTLGGLQEEARFATEFRDHMVFRAGNRGKVIIENVFGDPVYVLGEMGTGRVLFSSSYYGYTRPLVAVERQAFLGCIEWLAQ